MRISFRFKLMLSYLLILPVMAGSAYLCLYSTLQNSIVTSLTDHLVSQTRLAALMLNRNLNDLQHDAQPLAAKLGETITARITIISAGARPARAFIRHGTGRNHGLPAAESDPHLLRRDHFRAFLRPWLGCNG